MFIPRILLVLFLIFLALFACARDKKDKEQQPVVLKQVPEIQEIRPQKSVKIKVKRATNRNYSWEISGDDVDEIIKTDRRLKESLKNETSISLNPKQSRTRRTSIELDNQEVSE